MSVNPSLDNNGCKSFWSAFEIAMSVVMALVCVGYGFYQLAQALSGAWEHTAMFVVCMGAANAWRTRALEDGKRG